MGISLRVIAYLKRKKYSNKGISVRIGGTWKEINSHYESRSHDHLESTLPILLYDCIRTLPNYQASIPHPKPLSLKPLTNPPLLPSSLSSIHFRLTTLPYSRTISKPQKTSKPPWITPVT